MNVGVKLTNETPMHICGHRRHESFQKDVLIRFAQDPAGEPSSGRIRDASHTLDGPHTNSTPMPRQRPRAAANVPAVGPCRARQSRRAASRDPPRSWPAPRRHATQAGPGATGSRSRACPSGCCDRSTRAIVPPAREVATWADATVSSLPLPEACGPSRSE